VLSEEVDVTVVAEPSVVAEEVVVVVVRTGVGLGVGMGVGSLEVHVVDVVVVVKTVVVVVVEHTGSPFASVIFQRSALFACHERPAYPMSPSNASRWL